MIYLRSPSSTSEHHWCSEHEMIIQRPDCHLSDFMIVYVFCLLDCLCLLLVRLFMFFLDLQQYLLKKNFQLCFFFFSCKRKQISRWILPSWPHLHFSVWSVWSGKRSLEQALICFVAFCVYFVSFFDLVVVSLLLPMAMSPPTVVVVLNLDYL